MTHRSTQRARVIAAAIVVGSFAAAAPAEAQNLFVNPHFDTGTTSWTGINFTFDPSKDANGSGTSGSACITGSSVCGVTFPVANVDEFDGPEQCASGITAGSSYDFGGKLLITSAPPGFVANTALLFYSDGACTFGNQLGGTHFASNVTTTGTWQTSGATVVAPAGAQSALIGVHQLIGTAGDAFLNTDEMFLQLTAGVPALPLPWLIALTMAVTMLGAWAARRARA